MKTAILVVLGISLIGLFYFITPEKNKIKKEKENKNYPNKELIKQKLNKSGLYIIHRLMEESPNVLSLEEIDNTIDTTLIVTEGELPSIYMLLDNGISMSDKEINKLKEFVRLGNSAFVSVLEFGERFSEEFCIGDLTNTMWDEGVNLDFTHETYTSDYSYYFQRFQNNVQTYRDWNYFVPSNFKVGLNNVTTISFDTYLENPVFVKIPHGEGYFYLHSIPEVFVNESMFTQDGFEYAQSVLSHLPKGHYKWHNHLNEWDIEKEVNPNDDDRDIKKESPIQYILKDPNLRYAYLVLIFALLIYILFKTKRKQKIIPTIEPNENSSLEFVETVSKLYLKQEKHYKFIKHYEQSFIHFIKDKYYITSQNIDEDYIKSVSLKSDISIELIDKIFEEFEKAKKSYSYSTDNLIALHKKIEYFYRHCK
ncbi:hypothetical protein N9544_06680 [Flavobacteriales bacterium]|nr:hypothetical protein [Flavobacteriales bacterium]